MDIITRVRITLVSLLDPASAEVLRITHNRTYALDIARSYGPVDDEALTAWLNRR